MTDIAAAPRPRGAARRKARRPRTSARLAAVQALYQVAMTGGPAAPVVAEFRAHRLSDPAGGGGFGPADGTLFEALVSGAAADLEAIDRTISEHLVEGWTPDRLDSTLRAILRLGVHELLSLAETPRAVAVSEYVDIAHAFHDERAAGLVNGLLDRVSRHARPGEAGADGGAAADGPAGTGALETGP